MAGNTRLTPQFRPENYTLDLSLDPVTKTFSGSLKITGRRQSKPSYRLTLNQSGLKISKIQLFKLEKKIETEIPITRLVHHNKLQEVRVHTTGQLHSGSYRIELEYSGKISTTEINGIYTSHWQTEDGNPKELITTQFEPHYARTFLPCIDEPEAKATVDLTISTPNSKELNQKILFNTLPEKELVEDGIKKVVFKHTPKMSTYLLALIIGGLECTSNNSKSGALIQVFSTPEKVQSTEFALNFAARALDFLEERFKIKYPLEKLDLVAIPDFDAGGMENWGLITFREELLLFDPQLSTLADKQAIALTVAHEVAHQWFGNLVTMKWWDELWLNEGFANFMEYYIVDRLFPEWRVFEGYLVCEKSSAIRLDSLPSSRAIVKKVTHPHHAIEVFDEIAYEKSGNIVRMIYSLIGEAAFMKGLNNYFTKFKFSCASSKDLISCWQQYTKLDLTKFTKAWLYEPGLPLLNVSLGKNPQQIELRQSRFLANSDSKKDLNKQIKEILQKKTHLNKLEREFYQNYLQNHLSKNSRSLWHIPLDFVFQDPKNQASASNSIMTKAVHRVQLPKDAELPLKLNAKGNSFYLANYSTEFLAGLSLAIKNGKLEDLDLLNLLCDIISLNRAGQFEPGAGAVLDILASGNSTLNSHFWGLTGGFIGYLHHHLKQKGQEAILYPYTRSLISPARDKLPFESSDKDSAEVISTRFEILSMAAIAQDPAITTKFLSIYQKASGIAEIEPEKRLLCLYSVARRGKMSDYQKLLKAYESNISDVNLREDLTYALCSFEDPELLSQSLKVLQNSELVKTQDILSWLSMIVSSSQAGAKLVVKWVTKNGGWQWLEDVLSPTDLNSTIKITLSSTYSNKALKDLRQFFEKLDNFEILKSLNEATEIAKSRITWSKKELPKVINYLSENRF